MTVKRKPPPGFTKPNGANGHGNGSSSNGSHGNGSNGNGGSKPKKNGHHAAAAARAEVRTKAKDPKTRVKATLRTALLRTPLPQNRLGRPTKYRPEMAAAAAAMVLEGRTDREICTVLGIDVATMWRWTHKHAEFCKALARSKEQVCELVERSVAERAIGYNITATKVFMPAGFDQPVYAHHEQHIPGDPAAARLYLYNNNPQKYHDRLEVAGSLETMESSEARANRQIAVRVLLAEMERRHRAGEPPLFPDDEDDKPAMIESKVG